MFRLASEADVLFAKSLVFSPLVVAFMLAVVDSVLAELVNKSSLMAFINAFVVRGELEVFSTVEAVGSAEDVVKFASCASFRAFETKVIVSVFVVIFSRTIIDTFASLSKCKSSCTHIAGILFRAFRTSPSASLALVIISEESRRTLGQT